MSWPELADLSRLPLPGTDAPGSIRFTPDGSALTYLQGEGTLVRSLWRHDLESGRRTRLAGPAPEAQAEESLSAAERLQRERRRTMTLGVTEYSWLGSASRPVLLVPMGGRAHVASGEQTRLGVEPVDGVEDAAAIVGSPDGGRLAFVRDGDLWVLPLPGGPASRLSHEATEGVFNGLAEYVAAEELDRFEGLWWSCDARQIAYAHVDEREVTRLAIAHLGAPTPRHEEHRYPFAGGPNPRVTLRIVDLDGGATRQVSLGARPDDYLARVIAHPLGGWLVAMLARDQRELRWSRVAVGASCIELWLEKTEPWLNLDDHTRVLSDGRILRSTERGGYRHLELRSADGELVSQLTGGGWAVTDVAHVDETRQEVLFVGTADDPRQRHLYRVPLEATVAVEAPERMTAEPGWHQVSVSADGERWADLWSDRRTAPRLVVRERGASTRGVTLVAAAATAEALGVAVPELLEVRAADGETTLHAALHPPETSSAGPPPCVVWVYGGPHAQHVRDSWELTVHPLRQYLWRHGVAVLVVDNRGSSGRGLAFEAAIAGRLGDPEVADQAAAVRQLAERGLLDAARVGITGGSYGGFMTLRAMALEPDLFRVGVAVAPVTDWEGYDTAYTERYLGTPGLTPDAYRRSSALELAARIRGSLLLIHGALDENVHLRHSVRLVAALQAAGRDVELVLLPDDRHRTRTQAGLATRDRRTLRHLLAGLGLPLPPGLGAERQAATGS